MKATNLNPHGQVKDIAQEVKRDIKNFEKIFIKKVLNKPEDVVKIYEVKRDNWNLFLLKDNYFLSIPKFENDGCKPSIYGPIEHAEKYNIFKNL